MIIISDQVWDAYIKSLKKIDEKAGQEMFRYLAETEWFKNGRTKQAAIEYAYALATKYGEAATSLACEMYDAVMEASAGTLWQPATPAPTASYSDVAKAINGTAKYGNDKLTSNAVSRLVKRAEADTMLQNAVRDGAEVAWIPNGDTCAFCLALASRGWQKASKKTLMNGHAEHIHANCDCTYAVRPDSSWDVEGYNPDKYKRIYNGAEGNTPQEKINSIRRNLRKKDKGNVKKSAKTTFYNEYIKQATPGLGKIIKDPNYSNNREHKEDESTAKWIVEKLGGDIRLIAEKRNYGQECVDAFWNGAYIEFKKPTTENAIRKRIRKGTSQLAAMGNTELGRLLIDISNSTVDKGKMIETMLDEAPKRNKQKVLDIILKDGDELVNVYRIKK